MSRATIDNVGKVKIHDGKADPEEVVTEEDVKDTAKLARMMARLLATVAGLRRAFAPRRVDFEDQTVPLAATTTIHLEHGLGGRVRWWVCDTDTPVYPCKNIVYTTENTLALDVYGDGAGTFSVRIESVG